jgi:LAGLIDADG endonuclease
MTDEWLAGFFDGEGCISGSLSFQSGKYIKNPRVTIQITITQKDKIILESIQKQYGGSIHEKKSGHPCWHLKWVGKENMSKILRTLSPYVICKRDQVLLALKFVETLRDDNLGCEPLPNYIHAERKEIYDKLRICKSGYGQQVS